MKRRLRGFLRYRLRSLLLLMLLAACFSAWYGTRVYDFFQNWRYPVPTTVDFDYPFDQSAFDTDMPNPVPIFIDFGGAAETPLARQGRRRGGPSP